LEYFKKKDTKPGTKGENTIFVWGTNGKIAEKQDFEEGILTRKETYTYDSLDQMILYVGYEKKEVLSDSLFETERSAVFYNKFGQFTKRVITKKYPECSNALAPVKTEETIITFEYMVPEKKGEAGKLAKKVSEKNECGSKSTIEICYNKMGFRTTYIKKADGKVVFTGKREYEFFTEKK
ncbi:MAG: hypothetical protein IAF38_11595, partial [Bacteroidia bacterium]|nr:hypothetical protein [Bacteroidia bacterium]